MEKSVPNKKPYPVLGIIVAMNENRVIGSGNKLMWRLPSDLRRFKVLTTGGSVIMGRKTFESIGRPLPDRTNVVVSRQPDLSIDGCEVVQSLESALDLIKTHSSPSYVIGGGEIYKLALPYASFIALTLVHDAGLEGDTTFPELPETEWECIKGEKYVQTLQDEFPTSFLAYKRK